MGGGELEFGRGEEWNGKGNFKGYMADNTQAYWNAVRKIYRGNDLRLPMVDQERTCHWSISLDKVMQENIKANLQFQHKQLWKDYKDVKTIDNANTKYHMIFYGGCHLVLLWKKIFLVSPSGWGTSFLLHAMGWSYDFRKYITKQYTTMKFIFECTLTNKTEYGI